MSGDLRDAQPLQLHLDLCLEVACWEGCPRWDCDVSLKSLDAQHEALAAERLQAAQAEEQRGHLHATAGDRTPEDATTHRDIFGKEVVIQRPLEHMRQLRAKRAHQHIRPHVLLELRLAEQRRLEHHVRRNIRCICGHTDPAALAQSRECSGAGSRRRHAWQGEAEPHRFA